MCVPIDEMGAPIDEWDASISAQPVGSDRAEVRALATFGPFGAGSAARGNPAWCRLSSSVCGRALAASRRAPDTPGGPRRNPEPGEAEMAREKNFFPMQRGEKVVLSVLILFAAASFLPFARSVEVGGVLLFGWLMAALMLLSPILTLWVFWRGRPRN
jgi:hypothetical protein